jgi:hypothetical protein
LKAAAVASLEELERDPEGGGSPQRGVGGESRGHSLNAAADRHHDESGAPFSASASSTIPTVDRLLGRRTQVRNDRFEASVDVTDAGCPLNSYLQRSVRPSALRGSLAD